MKLRFAQRLAAAVACLGMVGQPVFAATPAAAPAVADVALQQGGVFQGKLVSAQGAPLANAPVSIQQAGQVVAKATSDANGGFAVAGMQGGLYQVVAQDGVVSYRLWAPNTAPPAANQAALIVTGQEVLAGNHGNGHVLSWVREHPLLVAAGIATAIAVPIAVADDDDPASP